MNAVQLALMHIRADVAKGVPLETAARRFAIFMPKTAALVLDQIGSWPSSEPELAALQKVAP